MEFPDQKRRVALTMILSDNPNNTLIGNIRVLANKLNPVSNGSKTKTQWKKYLENRSHQSDFFPKISDSTAGRLIDQLEENNCIIKAGTTEKNGEEKDLIKFDKNKIRKELWQTEKYRWESALWRHLIDKRADF